MKTTTSLLLICFLFTSCGYRFGKEGMVTRYSTICVPFVQGDNLGLLTTALIREMAIKGALTFCYSGAELALQVCLLEPSHENIGFTYAPEPDGNISNILVSNEARLTITAEVTLMDRCSAECVMGPVKIISSIDYDFESDLSNVDFHAFSLGQLEMNNLAKDAAFPPLYHLLAEKIVDYVNHSW